MMQELYLFDRMENLIGIVPAEELYAHEQEAELNKLVRIFVSKRYDTKTEEAFYIGHKDIDDESIFHMYRTTDIRIDNGTMNIEGIHTFFDEMKAVGYLEDRRPNNQTAMNALAIILEDTRWQIGGVHTSKISSGSFYYQSKLSAFWEFIDAWGIEFGLRMAFTNGVITGRYVDIYDRISDDNGKWFERGDKLIKTVMDEQRSEIYTALVGRGRGEEKFDETGTATGGFGRKINFKDVEWSISNGDPLNKPLGQAFIELPTATAMYGFPDGSPRIGIVEFDRIEEPELLLQATYEELLVASRPRVELEAEALETGLMELGEVVAIIDDETNIRYKTRVFKLRRNFLNKKDKTFTFGDKLTESLASRIKKIDSTNARREETIIQYIQTAANGKNKIFRSEIEPTEGMVVNDLWYKPIGNGETEMYQWDGMIWELILSTLDTNKVQREVEEALAQSEEAKQIAENAYNDAVEEADRLVTAETTRVDAIIDTVNADILNVKNNADRAIASIDTAVANAGFTSLDATLADITSISDQAKANATTALSQAQSAVAVAGGVSGRITTVENSVDDINGVLVNKVSTVDFNALTGRVGIAETTISQHDSAISLRATKTEAQGYAQNAVDGLEIGGRNLFSVNQYVSLRNSQGTSYGNMYSLGSSGALVVDGIDGATEYEVMKMVDLKANTEYIFTFNIPINDRFSIYNTDGVAVNVTRKWSSDNTQLTFKMVVDGYIGGKFFPIEQIYPVEIYLMAEKGNKATDWTPAPEDVEASITTVQSNLTVEAGKIALSATKTELTTAINGIQIGGRNLLRNSAFNSGATHWYVNGTASVKTIDGKQAMLLTNTTGGGFYTSPVVLVTGSIYTFSYLAKSVGTTANIYFGFLNEPVGRSTTQTVTNVWKRYTYTISNPIVSDSQLVHFYGNTNIGSGIYITDIKLEKGNKATDWSPAPEDVDGAISTVQSNLTVEAGKISAVTARVSGTESSIASVKQTADGNTATVANHAGQISTINQTVSGLQSIVADKADKTQITQLSDAIVLKADKTALSSKKDEYKTTITINGNGNTYYPLYFIQGNQSVPRVIRITRMYHDPAPGNVWNPSQPTHPGGLNMEWVGNFGGWGGAVYKAALTSFGEEYSTMLADLGIEHYAQSYAFYLRGGGANYTISSDQPLYIKVGYTTNDVIFGNYKSSAPKTSVNRSRIDGLIMAQNSQISVLSDQINLRVTKGDVVSQINIEANRTLISSGKILLDGNTYTMGTAFVNDLKAKSIEAVNANIASIRSSILTADVITSGMVATSTALITKIFATDATVTTLTGKTAFINSIKAITISADKVTTGTLNASNVNIINLNVSKLTGNITNFVQSAWNTINSSVSITGDGIVSSNSAGRFVHYSNGGVVFGGGGERTVLRNNTGATTNRSGISLEPVGSNLNGVDFDIYTRGTSAFHMGTSDYDLGYRLRLANSETNTNNYYISLKTGSQFDFELGQSTAAKTSKNTLEIQRYDANGNIRIGKNATYGASMFISGSDIIFAKGGTTSRVNVYANRFVGTGYTYIEGANIYGIEKTISHIIQQLQWYTSYFKDTKWQNA